MSPQVGSSPALIRRAKLASLLARGRVAATIAARSGDGVRRNRPDGLMTPTVPRAVGLTLPNLDTTAR
jgi:hypothetical protein